MSRESICVFGSTGFVGTAFSKFLIQNGHSPFLPTKKEVNFKDKFSILSYLKKHRPKYIYNFVGVNGNLTYNLNNKFKLLSENTTMYNNFFEVLLGLDKKPEKVLSLISSCAYPSKENLFENELFKSEPHSSVVGHAYAKRHLQLLSDLYSNSIDKENEIAVCLCPPTIYGPGESLDYNKAKVVGSLIIKILKAKRHKTRVGLYGDGTSKRQLLYIDDAVRLIEYGMREYSLENYALHICHENEFSIDEIVKIICNIIKFDYSNIDYDYVEMGQKSKKLISDDSFVKNFKYKKIKSGLRETINYYSKVI